MLAKRRQILHAPLLPICVNPPELANSQHGTSSRGEASTHPHVVIATTRREPLPIRLEVGRVDWGARIVPVDDQRCALHGVDRASAAVHWVSGANELQLPGVKLLF